MIDKYIRRDYSEHVEVFHITYLQFSKRYKPTNTEPKDKADFKPQQYFKVEVGENLDNISKVNFIVTHDLDAKKVLNYLPKCIRIKNAFPGEPQSMKLRKTFVARLHKFNRLKNPHEFYYSELQLYKPFDNEALLYPDSLERCKELYEDLSPHNNIRKISNIKRVLMEHLEIVEEGMDNAKDIIESNAGLVLDNKMEQENAEYENEGYEEHGDFIAKDPDVFENVDSSGVSGAVYKKIELDTNSSSSCVIKNLWK